VGGFVASQAFRGIAALTPHEVGNLIDIVDVFFKCFLSTCLFEDLFLL